jgi:predicted AlkP superfamily phosphohydrolase/phosphomutase
VLDPGRIYVHRKGRFPLGTVDDAEAADLLGRVREGLLALRDDSPGAPADGRPVSRIFARDELYHGPALDAAPDAVIHFNDGYDPKGALSQTEVFGRSALTGMHTYADSLFFVNRPAFRRTGSTSSTSRRPFSPSSASTCRVTWTVACGSTREAPARPSRPSPQWGPPH